MLPTRPLRICYMLPHHNTTGEPAHPAAGSLGSRDLQQSSSKHDLPAIPGPGGMKCLVEHLRLLKARGHFTIAAHRSDSAETAMPPWSDVRPDVDLVCKLHQRLGDVYNVHDIDVVVVGIFHQVGPSPCQCFPLLKARPAALGSLRPEEPMPCAHGVQVAELLAGLPAPVLYWEQGHEWIFGDPIRFQVRLGSLCLRLVTSDNYSASWPPDMLVTCRRSTTTRSRCALQLNSNASTHRFCANHLCRSWLTERCPMQDQLYHMVLHLPVVLAAVSEAVQNILSSEFGRTPLLIPNGVDCERFFPGARSGLRPDLVLSAPLAKGNVGPCLLLCLQSPRYSRTRKVPALVIRQHLGCGF